MQTQVIRAKEGFTLRRIKDKLVVGEERYLGMNYFLSGIRIDKPYMEVPEHYEEIPIEEAEEEKQLKTINYEKTTS